MNLKSTVKVSQTLIGTDMSFSLVIQAGLTTVFLCLCLELLYLGFETNESDFHDNGLDHFVKNEKVEEKVEYDDDQVTDEDDQDEGDGEYTGELEPAEESESDESGSDFEPETLVSVKKSKKTKKTPKQKRTGIYVNRKKLGISNTSCEICFKDLETSYRLYRHR